MAADSPSQFSSQRERASITGVVSALRNAGRVGRAQTKRLEAGERGCFDVEILIGGFPEVRRKELVDKLSAINDGRRGEPRNDGNLYLMAGVDGYSLEVAAAAALSQFSDMLRKVELSDTEIFTAETTLIVRATTERELPAAPVSARAKLAEKASQRLGRTSYGLTVAAADASDMEARQKHGDRSYTVQGSITGLANSIERVRALVSEIGKPAEFVKDDGTFDMSILCQQVGTPLGALLLSVRKLGPLLAQMPRESSLRFSTSPGITE